MSAKVKIAVVGASGYSGMELLRLLSRHDGVEIVAVTSRSLSGKVLSSEFPRLKGVGNADSLRFTDPDVAQMKATGATIAFLALPHGVSVEYAPKLLAEGICVIDLSADFRLRSAELYQEFYGHAHAAPDLLEEAVYALPEIRPAQIQKARLIACPGCYPTSILLPLIPLLRENLLTEDPIAVSSMSGASGGGRKESIPFLFCEVAGSLRAYSVPKHRHLSEIGQELDIAAQRPVKLSFIPHLVPVHSGIHTTTFATPRDGVTLEQISNALEKAYAHQPFVRLLGAGQCPDTKNVVGTNFIDIGWTIDPRASRLILLSAEDNLGKGAASQAVQNMNLVCGFPSTAGLMYV